jgi:hypothetical protein
VALVQIDWRPDAPEMRKFGVVVLIGMGIIGALFQFWAGAPQVALGCWIAGAILGVPALTGTRIGLPGYWLWMGIAFVMGNIMSRVLLVGIYFLVVTPIGLLRRAFGGDALGLKTPNGDSHWIDVKGDSGSTGYERQF